MRCSILAHFEDVTTNSHNLFITYTLKYLTGKQGALFSYIYARTLSPSTGSSSPSSLFSLPLAETPHGPRTHPSTLTTLTMHSRINGLKECSYTLYKERAENASTSDKAMPFHIPSSLLIYVTTISPYHPTASSTSCLHTNYTYTTSHSLLHIHHLTHLEPPLE